MSQPRAAILVLALLLTAAAAGSTSADSDPAAPDACSPRGLQVQVLGSGGPDVADGRAASGYLVWLDGKARVLVDLGTGAALRFRESGARAADLDIVLFTHLHADHTLDFPALVAAATREGRTRPLPLYGPTGNRLAPSTVTFMRTLLDGTRGAYRYLGGVLSPLSKDGFKLEPHDVRERPARVGVRRDSEEIVRAYASDRITAIATYVIHGAMPALAWRVQARDRSIVFTGDTNGEGGRLERLARDADLMVADHAAPEGAEGAERYEHMPPSVIGRLTSEAGVKRLVLSHRTRRTLGREEASLAAIRTHYAGPVVFADDLACFTVP